MTLKVLSTNIVSWRTGSAKIQSDISNVVSSKWYKTYCINWYWLKHDLNLLDWDNIFSSEIQSLSYYFWVGINFLFDIITPWNLNYKKLETMKEYQEANIVHLHGIEWGYFDYHDLPKISKEKKVIWTLHDDWFVAWWDPTPPNLFPYKTKRSFLARKKILQASHIEIVWVSQWMTQKAKKSWFFPIENIHTIYNGIDTDFFHPIDDRMLLWERFWIPRDKRLVLFLAGAGKKSELKWLKYSLKIREIYKNNPDIFFVSVWNSTRKLVDENFLELPFVSQEDMRDLFNRANFFLYPTLADSFGLVIAEALACGCPVLSFSVGAIPELVNHKNNGYIAEYKNISSLIDWFSWMLENEMNITREHDLRFSIQNMQDGYIQLYRKMMSR